MKNLSFSKSVFLRVTHDNWATHEDHPAQFESSSKKAVYDIFAFAIPLPVDSLESGLSHTFYMVIGYQEGENSHWDNNNGSNYAVSTVPHLFNWINLIIELHPLSSVHLYL